MLDGVGYLTGLNDRQRAAVTYGAGQAIPPPLLVIAGAGSGKTRTLAHRVAHLLAEGVDPTRILLMTFSRRAAQELTRRVEGILSKSGKAWPAEALSWSGTFHAIGARVLRENAQSLGLDPDFSIHDREDSADLMNLVRHELGLSSTESRFPAKGTCLAIFSRCVNSGSPLDEVLKDHFPRCAQWQAELKRLFSTYVAAKQAQNVLDYDDLLLAWAQALEDATFAGWLGAQWDHILIDEFQDTNRLQAQILMALKPNGCGLTVVGDDAQSIYSFRSATVRNIIEFPKAFEPQATVITLDRNYRSTKPILVAANAVIGLARERFTKDLWTDRASGALPRLVTVSDGQDQARYIVDQILEARESGTRLMEQAVLFRTSSHSAEVEIELTRRNVPFVKFGGLKFLSAAHVKDLLSVLRFRLNPRDRVSGFRVLQLIPGIGPTSAARVLDALEAAPAPADALRDTAAPQRATADWPGLVNMMTTKAVWPDLISLVRAWYEPHMERLHEDYDARRGDLQQLEQIGTAYPTCEKFLTELTLDPPEATSGEAGVPKLDDDYLILSTIHSAKGQEWKSVFVLNVVDGCIPSDLGTGSEAEIEEERRLLYVAMTRAKDDLTLTVPLRFYVTQQSRLKDRHVYAMRSRFIPDEILGYFEQRDWSGGRWAERRARASAPSIDLKNRMRGMWE
jgi:DNA helicase-2/ATP-dependent DNA helicase PcrA